MDKSFIERRIEQKAANRVQIEMNQARKAIAENPILDRLKIKIGEQEFYVEKLLSNKDISNLEHILASRKEQLIAEESDYLLNSLDSIKSYLESVADSRNDY